MLFCARCGCECLEGAAYCHRCGERLTVAANPLRGCSPSVLVSGLALCVAAFLCVAILAPWARSVIRVIAVCVFALPPLCLIGLALVGKRLVGRSATASPAERSRLLVSAVAVTASLGVASGLIVALASVSSARHATGEALTADLHALQEAVDRHCMDKGFHPESVEALARAAGAHAPYLEAVPPPPVGAPSGRYVVDPATGRAGYEVLEGGG